MRLPCFASKVFPFHPKQKIKPKSKSERARGRVKTKRMERERGDKIAEQRREMVGRSVTAEQGPERQGPLSLSRREFIKKAKALRDLHNETMTRLE